MLECYTTNQFSGDHMPTVYDSFSMNVLTEGRYLNLLLWDTAGQSDYDCIRPLAYPGADAFVVCYACDQPESLANAQAKWAAEARHFAPNTPVVLLATKTDLREPVLSSQAAHAAREPGAPSTVDFKKGHAAATEMRAAAFTECSALTQSGLKEAFEIIVAAALRSKSALAAAERGENNAACCFM